MSNFYESLQKVALLDRGEVELPWLETGNLPETPQRTMPEDTAVAPPPFDYRLTEVRRANLKVSARAPLFPFDGKCSAAEQYRIIRTKLLHHPRRPRVVVISSGGPGDGKTISSINIAAAFALKPELRVALVDADMRRPQIAKLLGLTDPPGLVDVLSGTAPLHEAMVCPEQFPNLCVLPAGAPGDSQAELLGSPAWKTLVEVLRQNFDYVIFDAPPIATVTDYELVQEASDGVVVVARPDYSQRKSCLKALETVPKDKLLGVALNCVDDWFLWRTSNYAYYSPEEQ